MHANLTAKVRAVNSKAEVYGLAESLLNKLTSHVDLRDSGAAVIIAPIMGKPKAAVAVGEDPALGVWLLLDPLDIDSKQTTFARGPHANEWLEQLYKWNPDC